VVFQSLDWPGIEVPAPGTYTVLDKALHIDRVPLPGLLVAPSGGKTAYMSPSAVKWPLTCRLVRDGDRLRPLGMAGHAKKLQDLFTDDKVPVNLRRNAIVLADEHEVLWIPGHRLSEVVKVRPGDQYVWRFRLLDGD
jgi:tRNA(Ile)-lysidine synthetase-like protein